MIKWLIKWCWEKIRLIASRRGRLDISQGTNKKKKGGPLTREGKVGRQSEKVELLFQLLPSLPFEEQIGFLGRFLHYKVIQEGFNTIIKGQKS